jgi:cytochrome c
MDYKGLLQGGGRGPTIVPGKPDESVLIHAVRQDGELKMPPGAKLSLQDIATLTEWIQLGAPWGTKLQPPEVPETTKQRYEVVRLPPTAFRDLPKELVRELQKRGCTIPQSKDIGEPHNVVRGQFTRPGQTDWAVLCSKDRASTLTIFWNGSRRNPFQIARTEDRDGSNPYSRQITAVEIHDSRIPSPIDHQGIKDSGSGGAPVVHYYLRGKWVHLTWAPGW